MTWQGGRGETLILLLFSHLSNENTDFQFCEIKKKSASSNSTLCPPVPPWRPFMCSIHHLPIDFLKVYHSLLVDVLPLHSKVPMRKKMTDHSCTKPDALRCTYPWGFCHLFPSHWQEWLPVLWDVVNLTWPQPNSCP